MLWLKRNGLLLVMILAAVGLLTGAIFYLLKQMKHDKAVAASLQQAQTRLAELVNFEPSLTDENIQLIQQESKWFEGYAPQVSPLLAGEPVPMLDNLAFKSLLENTLSQLASEAESGGVKLRAKYSFTFEQQRTMVQFTNDSIPVLTKQLMEIKELCQILFRSKIHYLESIRRVRAYNGEPASPEIIEGKAIATNGAVSITPYEVVFQGFTPELSAVLEGLEQSGVFFTVKRVVVQAQAPPPPPPAPPLPPPTTGRPPTRPKAGATPAAPAPTVTTIVDEKPLRVLLTLEVVKSVAAAAKAPAL